MGRSGDKQLVSLQKFGCIRHGIIQHELLHALGFYHEHTRTDRDKYIKINWDNIIDRKTSFIYGWLTQTDVFVNHHSIAAARLRVQLW